MCVVWWCLSLTLLCAVVFVTDLIVLCVVWWCLLLTLLCDVVFVTDRPVCGVVVFVANLAV